MNPRTAARRAPRPRRTSPGRGWTVDFSRTSRVDPRSSRAGALLGDVQAGVGAHGAQGPQSGPAVGTPLVEIGVLPPPQLLERPAGLVVLEAVDEVGDHGRDVFRDPER